MKLLKKLNKGFTLVELVVVIAVIAILSAVSVAAYTGITAKANQSVALQNAKQRYEEILTIDAADGLIDLKEGSVALIGREGFEDLGTAQSPKYAVNGNKTGYTVTNWSSNGYNASFDGSSWNVVKA